MSKRKVHVTCTRLRHSCLLFRRLPCTSPHLSDRPSPPSSWPCAPARRPRPLCPPQTPWWQPRRSRKTPCKRTAKWPEISARFFWLPRGTILAAEAAEWSWWGPKRFVREFSLVKSTYKYVPFEQHGLTGDCKSRRWRRTRQGPWQRRGNIP